MSGESVWRGFESSFVLISAMPGRWPIDCPVISSSFPNETSFPHVFLNHPKTNQKHPKPLGFSKKKKNTQPHSIPLHPVLCSRWPHSRLPPRSLRHQPQLVPRPGDVEVELAEGLLAGKNRTRKKPHLGAIVSFCFLLVLVFICFFFQVL